MSVFRDNILSLIESLYSEEVYNRLPSLTTPFPILYLPRRQLAFHLIPVPTQNTGVENQYLLQNLTLEAKRQNIRLINLFEDFYWTKNELVNYRIRVLLGVFDRVHARNTSVNRLDKKTLDCFLSTNNLYGSSTARYKYGLFHNSKLVAAASFSVGRPIERGGKLFRSYELVRFANLNGYIVAGGVGKLLNRFIQEVNPDDIMSYADLDWSSGASYEKLGFKLDSITPPLQFWINAMEKIRYYPHKLPLNLIEKSVKQNRMIEEVLTEEGYFSFFNSGNLKYLLIRKK